MPAATALLVMTGLNTVLPFMPIPGVLNTTLGPVMVVVPVRTAPFVRFSVALPNRLTVLLAPASIKLPAVTVPPAAAPPTVNVPLLTATLPCAVSVPPG